MPHHGYVHTVSDYFRPAEKFDKTLCSHGTVQYFQSVQTEIWAARRLNFRTVKVGPCERRKIRPMPCERNLREDISNWHYQNHTSFLNFVSVPSASLMRMCLAVKL